MEFKYSVHNGYVSVLDFENYNLAQSHRLVLIIATTKRIWLQHVAAFTKADSIKLNSARSSNIKNSERELWLLFLKKKGLWLC